MFLLYDTYSLFGLYWKIDTKYCSPMKYGFTPVMPLEFYSEFNKAIFNRIIKGNNTLNQEEVIKICDRNLQWLKKNGKIYNKPIQIEIIYKNDPQFKNKVLFNLKNNYPFVMRGVNLTCFKTMKYEELLKKAGNNKVYMHPGDEKTCPENIFTELKKIEKNKCYITNSTNLFKYYDDLLPDSDMDIIKNIINGYMKNNSKQLFLGIVKGTGTNLHAAYTNNFYLMIQGKKKWSFFNPNQIALLYPSFHINGIYMASESRFLNMNTDTHIDKFPLLKYVERYEVDLEERDILYNPSSWFHSVYNKTDISVACSTRWSLPIDIPDRHMLRYGNLANQYLRNYIKDIYIKNGVFGISQIDEHKHMIGENNIDAIPFWDKHTNDSHNLCKEEECYLNWHKNVDF
jgi:hypothetical protein